MEGVVLLLQAAYDVADFLVRGEVAVDLGLGDLGRLEQVGAVDGEPPAALEVLEVLGVPDERIRTEQFG